MGEVDKIRIVIYTQTRIDSVFEDSIPFSVIHNHQSISRTCQCCLGRTYFWSQARTQKRQTTDTIIFVNSTPQPFSILLTLTNCYRYSSKRDKVLNCTSWTASFPSRKVPELPFSVVTLYTTSLPWPHSPAHLVEVNPSLQGEKPETRTVDPVSPFT